MVGEVGSGRMPPLVVSFDPPRSTVRRALPVAFGLALGAAALANVIWLAGSWATLVAGLSVVFAGHWSMVRRRREQRVRGPIRCRIVLPKASPTEDPDADMVLGPESVRLVRGRVDRPKKGSFTVEWADVDRLVLSGRPSAPVLDLESGGEVSVRLRPDLTGPDVESRLRPADRSQSLIPRTITRSWFR